MLEPARLGCCGLRLHTAASLVVALDVFRALLALSSLLSVFVAGVVPSIPTVAFSALLLAGAAVGVLGVGKKHVAALSVYVVILVARVAVGLAMAGVYLSHIHEQVAEMVDDFITRATEDARANHQDIPDFDRDAMIDGAAKALTFVTVLGALLSVLFTLYCAHLIRSLRHWLTLAQHGASDTTHAGGPPGLYRYVAHPREPLLLAREAE